MLMLGGAMYKFNQSFIVFLAVLMISQPSFAVTDRVVKINKLFDWAEANFTNYFPSHQNTQQYDSWNYRFYPASGNYVGVNTNDEAYVLGKSFNGLSRIDTLTYLLGSAGLDTGIAAGNNYTVLAANDLGMHCADQDFRIFSILPPYNVVHAQVVHKGTNPRLLGPGDGITLEYKSTSSNILNAKDNSLPPIASNSINTSSKNGGVRKTYKTNFWDITQSGDTVGTEAYRALYPVGVLDSFEASKDTGLPAPDLVELYLGSGNLTAEQSIMPGKVAALATPYASNEAKPFNTYVQDFPFFKNFPFGYIAKDFRRFVAEGIPMSNVDDASRENPYPLIRVQAKDSRGDIIGHVDAVTPVSSETDCQVCHVAQSVCDLDSGRGLACDDIANTKYATVNFIEDAKNVLGADGHQKVVNASKINILRLHDHKNGTTLAPDNNDGTNKDGSTPNVVCATCHYSPALDLAHLGPNDDNGKEQTKHVSMSAAMHRFHGGLAKKDPQLYGDLFPIMPPPGSRDSASVESVLYDSCYNCHPGKNTKCLRGAMGGAGVVCQDCHGQMEQIGNDFTLNFPNKAGDADFNKRVPWASEPNCQSCHVGDELQIAALKTSGQLQGALFNNKDEAGNLDNIRLQLSYALQEHSSNGGDNSLNVYDFSNSRFASNEKLYRLSGGKNASGKGHAGLSCENCHGSTHAIWPNKNPYSNDNQAAKDIQGHDGFIMECTACHDGDLGNTLGGPHGMHPVGDTRFANGGHEDIAEHDLDSCRTCHGQDLRGSVLSRAAIDRTIYRGRIQLKKGQPVSCVLCHGESLNFDDD